MIELRVLTHSDMPEAIALRALCRAEETAGAEDGASDAERELPLFISWMDAAEANDDARLLYGAFEDGRMLGVAFGSFVESKSAPEDGFELNGLWVYPSERGRGVSLRLLIKLLSEFKRMGAPKMVVYNYHCAPSNAFYRRFGCKVIDTEDQNGLPTDIFEGDIDELIIGMSASLDKRIQPI